MRIHSVLALLLPFLVLSIELRPFIFFDTRNPHSRRFILVSTSFTGEITSTEGFETKQSPIPVTISFSQPVLEFDPSLVIVFSVLSVICSA